LENRFEAITLYLVQETVWRKCSSCKKDLLFGAPYYVCSVSTCQGKVTNYAFCSVACWDAHLPVERHRSGSAGAIERKAPSSGDAAAAARKVVVGRPTAAAAGSASAVSSDEVLVVVTKVRKYIADRAGMNTAASVYDALTEKIKNLCDGAIEQARSESRKTVMDRDFK
jgi:hypothetical protein